MTDYINARERFRRAKPSEIPTHKFTVGVRVAYRVSPTSEPAIYEVTRLLPDGGFGLQYRIRSDRDGQERVVIESALSRAG